MRENPFSAPVTKKTAQRQVLYLGEINDSQREAWRKTLSLFDERQQEYRQLSLFPSDRSIREGTHRSRPTEAVGWIEKWKKQG